MYCHTRDLHVSTHACPTRRSSDHPTVQRVVLEAPGLCTRAATGAPECVAKLGLTLVLRLFLLASGDMFFEKLVKSLPTLSDKKRGLRIAREVQIGRAHV